MYVGLSRSLLAVLVTVVVVDTAGYAVMAAAQDEVTVVAHS
jgi:hypothetical protein